MGIGVRISRVGGNEIVDADVVSRGGEPAGCVGRFGDEVGMGMGVLMNGTVVCEVEVGLVVLKIRRMGRV